MPTLDVENGEKPILSGLNARQIVPFFFKPQALVFCAMCERSF
jgi:hypothetical protein